MPTSRSNSAAQTRLALVRLVVVTAGVMNTFIGLALLAAPTWFFETIGDFPPYNRHYLGDAGAFLLPIGVGLLVAARAPARQRALIGLAAASSLLHAGNHLYDDLVVGAAAAHFVSDTLPLVALGLLLLGAYWGAHHNHTRP